MDERSWIEKRLAENEKIVRALKHKQSVCGDKGRFVLTINKFLKESRGLEEAELYCLKHDVPLRPHRWQQITEWLNHDVPHSVIAKAIGEPENVVEVYAKVIGESNGYSFFDDERTIGTTWLREGHFGISRNTDSTGYYEGGVGL